MTVYVLMPETSFFLLQKFIFVSTNPEGDFVIDKQMH